MNDVELAKNILIDKTCETCRYLSILNKYVYCIKDINNKKTTLINSCEKWNRRQSQSFEDVNVLLNNSIKTLGIPKDYLLGK